MFITTSASPPFKLPDIHATCGRQTERTPETNEKPSVSQERPDSARRVEIQAIRSKGTGGFTNRSREEKKALRVSQLRGDLVPAQEPAGLKLREWQKQDTNFAADDVH